MRIIKFRGYNKKNSQWLYGFYLQNRGEHFVCPDELATGKSWEDYEVDTTSVGQFTGLFDKKEQPIYEGDIVEATSLRSQDNRRKMLAQIVYDEELVCFAFKTSDRLRHINTSLPDIDVDIVGNIYDNPEILKKLE